MSLQLKKEIIQETSDTMFIKFEDMEANEPAIESFLEKGGRVIVREAATGSSTWQNQTGLITPLPVPLRIVQSMAGESDKTESSFDRTTINDEAWKKYCEDAFVGSAIDRLAGRVMGRGFNISSHIYNIQEYIDELVDSPINELYSSYLGMGIRKMTEYELFLRCSIHNDGFIEFDVVEPNDIAGSGNLKHGILPHKTKATLPLWYRVKKHQNLALTTVSNAEYELIPSIYHVYMPELANTYTDAELKGFAATPISKDPALEKRSKGSVLYRQYILSWRHGVKEILRNVSKLRTIFEPLEDFKQNKRWRSDYMKALTSYFIFYEFTDKMSWYRWQSLTPEKKRETGLLQTLRPGDRLLLPPGIKGTIQNPNLPKLSGDDEDLLKWMATAANTPYDIFASDSKGPTYASTKSSRPFYMDYINDWQGFTETFFIMDFFRFAFWVKSKLDKRFKYLYPIEVCTGWNNREAKFETKKIPAYKLISCNFPASQEINLGDVANGVLGSKRGDLTWHLGISKEAQAEKLGIQNYKKQLMKRAEEEKMYPKELVSNVGNSDMVDSASNSNLDSKKNPTKKLKKKVDGSKQQDPDDSDDGE